MGGQMARDGVASQLQQHERAEEDTHHSLSPCQNRRTHLTSADPNGFVATLNFDFKVGSDSRQPFKFGV
jgi:hypothetical protein